MNDTLTLYRDEITGLDYANDIGETTPTSWKPRRDYDFDELESICRTMATISGSLNWWVGDILNHAEDSFGEMASQLYDVFGWDYSKVQQVKWVSRNVMFTNRLVNISWTHHMIVASLEPAEQTKWLQRAALYRWSKSELREEIKGPQLPPPALSFAEPDEVPFNHHARTDIPANERTAIDEYEQQPEHFYPLTAANHAVSDDPDYSGDEWYTPREIIAAARMVMGDIDLDPASCAEAQERICAARYLTKEDDALRDDLGWHGRVWLNPPYSMPLIKQFVAKLIDQYEIGNISQAIILTNNSSDTSWFHDLLSRYPACFTKGRVQFWRADSTTFGARQGQTLFYLGDNFRAFREVFSELGQVVVKA